MIKRSRFLHSRGFTMISQLWQASVSFGSRFQFVVRFTLKARRHHRLKRYRPKPAWVKPKLSRKGDHTILGQAGHGLHLVLRHGYPYMGFFNNDLRSSFPVNENVWVHIAFIYDHRTCRQYIYVNGARTCKRKAKKLSCRNDLTVGYWNHVKCDNHFDGVVGTSPSILTHPLPHSLTHPLRYGYDLEFCIQ